MKNINQHQIIMMRIIAVALFLDNMDMAILASAIPQIAVSINASLLDLRFALTAYLITLGAFIPICGWIADKLGSRLVFSSALFLFGFGSFFCAIATNLPVLIFARILQGLGGAMMMALARFLLVRTFSRENLFRATALVAIPSLFGMVLGPLIGGLAVSYASWRTIFILNLPIAWIGALMAKIHIPNYVNPLVSKFDLSGFLSCTISIVCFTIVLENMTHRLVPTAILSTLLCIGSVASLFLIWHLIYRKNCFVDIRIFLVNSFTITVLGNFLIRSGVGGILFLLPLFLQSALKKNALEAGYLITYFAIAMLLMKFIGPRIITRFGYRKTMTFNTLFIAASIAALSFVNASSPSLLVALTIFATGFFISLQYSCMQVTSYSEVIPSMQTTAISIAGSLSQIGMAAGVAFTAAVLDYTSSYTEQNLSYVATYHRAFMIIAIYVAAIAPLFTFLRISEVRCK